ncbi:FixH family protein [Thalassomonas actiniarum]|uniref:FixH family protein n=1 Tax=Thalassomonas actiniarum TaxID=485447 RepID=A0AAE9YK56_9GAMM|nr:FixH family protein [Thalassomonas actiniarum]WDD97264.1 FixH family protein [Thalassomonas actiniarum]
MKTSWYKEPWAWLIFTLPAIAIVAGVATYIIANHEPDALVIGDYYKKGKAINLELGKIKQAQKLGIRFNLTLTDDSLVLSPTGIEKEFPLLNVNFHHATLAEKDFSLVLTADGNGDFRQALEQRVSGKWKITITPFENHWKIQDTLHLPRVETIEIVPDTAEAN